MWTNSGNTVRSCNGVFNRIESYLRLFDKWSRESQQFVLIDFSCFLSTYRFQKKEADMGTIISRKKRNAVINRQSVGSIPGRSAEEEGTPYMGDQATNQEPTAIPGKSSDEEDTPHMANQATNQGLTVCISHDNMNESDTEEESEARDESDSEKSHNESNDDENQSAHDSVSELSVSSKSSDIVTTEASASERSKTRSALDGVSSNEDFAKAWKEALLEDLDINVSDNVKIVRIFTSSTFTGNGRELLRRNLTNDPPPPPPEGLRAF